MVICSFITYGGILDIEPEFFRWLLTSLTSLLYGLSVLLIILYECFYSSISRLDYKEACFPAMLLNSAVRASQLIIALESFSSDMPLFRSDITISYCESLGFSPEKRRFAN